MSTTIKAAAPYSLHAHDLEQLAVDLTLVTTFDSNAAVDVTPTHTEAPGFTLHEGTDTAPMAPTLVVPISSDISTAVSEISTLVQQARTDAASAIHEAEAEFYNQLAAVLAQ
ncbi:hypothetical protein H2C43_04750 [Corynebacterium glutamicum]|nr:hypothetical protein [Corynebacterium glutamicum]ARV64172.1 hypothetical protein B7P23_04300 [Corynebacterium glutamicum]AUI01203.1 hypothetical protein CYL77_08680 [Corynebacterium glutamicum]AUI04853.1 hypothetical protein C0I99_12380 [Corynebacterium glutamicum]MBA4570297.1 hypothetical protein [Corynebacterium glutamicum]MBA4572259.1 hypothetical protein [Corynebacterium glutamicum]